MANFKVVLNKCRTVFFDLEFYVPESSRKEVGFCYNPWDKKCKFLGGSFLTINPQKDFYLPDQAIKRKVNSLWLWDYESEQELLKNILDILFPIVDLVKEAHQHRVSPLLCGIGITTSDVPILFNLFSRFKLLSNQDAFALQNSFRQIDLSQTAIGAFNNRDNWVYPKTKNEILNKHLKNKKFEDGRSVWDLYEHKDYEKISNRVVDEVFSTFLCYKSIDNEYRSLRQLKETSKKVENTVNK